MGMKKKKLLGFALMAALASQVGLAPVALSEVIELDSLKNLYEGVSFDHDMHIEIVGENCSVCHHHTAGTVAQGPLCITCHANSPAADDPTCSGCHEKEVFSAANMKKSWETDLLHHRSKPSLKAAYHQNCLACHVENGAPAGCTDCHGMTDAGEKFYDAGAHAPVPKAEGAGHGTGH